MAKLNVEQAAKLLGMEERTVRWHCQTGRLKAERFGARNWMIEEDDAKAFAEVPRPRGPKKKHK